MYAEVPNALSDDRFTMERVGVQDQPDRVSFVVHIPKPIQPVPKRFHCLPPTLAVCRLMMGGISEMRMLSAFHFSGSD
jgi:hypothetical protein